VNTAILRPGHCAAGARLTRGLFPLVVFAVSLAARLASLAFLLRTPFANSPILDAQRYFDLARAILSGTAPQGAFLYEPLYPYLQALLFTATGVDFRSLLICHALITSFGALLAYFVLREHLSERWSLAGALLYALYPPLLFLDVLPLKEPLVNLLLLGVLRLLQRSIRYGSWRRLFPAGLLLGSILLLRENLVVLLPFLALAFVAAAGPARVALRGIVALLLGTAIIVLPVTVRNCLVGGDCVLIAASGGPNLYLAFHDGARGDTYTKPPFLRSGPAQLTEDFVAEAARRLGRAVDPGESSRYWMRQAVAWVARHPGRTAELLVQRLWTSFGSEEISDNYPYTLFRRVNPLLGANPLSFALLFSLGPVGWWVVRRDRRTLLYPAVFLGTWAAFVPFWTLDRFRLPVVLPLVAGALFALRELAARSGAGEWRRAAALVVAAGVLLAISLPARFDERRRSEAVSLGWARGAQLLIATGRIQEAAAYLAQARREPFSLPEVDFIAACYYTVAGNSGTAFAELARFRAVRKDNEDAEILAALLLAERGARPAARAVLEEYLTVNPRSRAARDALANLVQEVEPPPRPSITRPVPPPRVAD